jgi:DNA primase catalytic core
MGGQSDDHCSSIGDQASQVVAGTETFTMTVKTLRNIIPRELVVFVVPVVDRFGVNRRARQVLRAPSRAPRRRPRAVRLARAQSGPAEPGSSGQPSTSLQADRGANESVYERVIAAVPLSVAFREFVGEDAVRPASEPGSYKVVCPFHDDRNPSLSISDSKKVWNCFGCGASGNLFGLEKRRFGLQTAAEALRSLASRYPDVKRIVGERIRPTTRGQLREQIEFPPIPELSPVPRAPQSRQWGSGLAKRRLASTVLNAANEYYLIRLQESKHVLNYLFSRGLSESTISSFGFGYAPDSRSMSSCLDYLQNRGFEGDACVDAGVAKRGSNRDVIYDVFRDRVVMPIRNKLGEVQSFAGRLLKDSDTAPKYVNGANSPVFQKKECLFGIDLAKEAESAHKEYGMVVLVEGYMDVAIIHEKSGGQVSCVASMGTAVSMEQINSALELLQDRVDGKLIVNLDGDSAGYTAAERLCESVLPVMTDVSCVHIAHPPAPYKDVGEYFENEDHTVEDYVKHLESTAKNWIEWRALRIIEPVRSGRELKRTQAEVEFAAELGASADRDAFTGSPEDELNAAGTSFTARQSEVLLQGSRSLLQGMSGIPAEAAQTLSSQASNDVDLIAGCPVSVLDQLAVFVSKALKVSPGTNTAWLVHGWANALCDGTTKYIPVLYDAMMSRIDRCCASWEETSPAHMIDFMPPPPWVIAELPKRSQARTRQRAGMDDEGSTLGIRTFYADKKLVQESKQRREFQEKYVLSLIEQSKSSASRGMRSNPRGAAEEIILRALIWAEEEVRIESLDEMLKVMIRMEEGGIFPFWTSKARSALFEYLLVVTGDLSVEEMAAECEKEPWWELSIELLFVPLEEFGDEELRSIREIEMNHPVVTVRQTAMAVEEMAQKVAAARAVDRLPAFLESRLGHGILAADEKEAAAREEMNEAISGLQFMTPEERAAYDAYQKTVVEEARHQLELDKIESKLLKGEKIELDVPGSTQLGDDPLLA